MGPKEIMTKLDASDVIIVVSNPGLFKDETRDMVQSAKLIKVLSSIVWEIDELNIHHYPIELSFKSSGNRRRLL